MSKFIKIIFFVFLNFCLLFSNLAKASEKIKIGLMVPLTGSNKELGQSIIKAVRLAVKDINNNSIVIIPKDTATDFDFLLFKYTDEYFCSNTSSTQLSRCRFPDWELSR